MTKKKITFAELFVGGSQAHGRYQVETGSCTTLPTAATPADYAAHLAGKIGLGLVPVHPDGTCRFAAIDVDVDTIDHQALYAEVRRRRMPLTVFRSKSGAAHAVAFMKKPGLPAAAVIQTLRRWAGILGYPDAEIFPKQTKITKRDCGNWINLPYIAAKNGGLRYAIGEKGALTLEEFLASVEYYDPATCKADEAKPEPEPAEPIAAGEADGKIIEGERSNSLISIAGTLRNRNLDQDAIEAALQAHNRTHCLPPLPAREVATIAASAARYRPVERHNLTDVGNAERFIDRCGEDVRHDHKRRRWFCWDGQRYQSDARGRVERLARGTARAIFQEVATAKDADQRGKLASWALRSEFERSLRAMLWVARTWEGVAVLPDEFDRDPMLLNCKNGTLDLRTGELREPRRADLITKVAAAAYDAAATCPRFDKFLNQIMRGKPELLGYLRRLAGYFLTGLNDERAFFLGYGAQGDNGKTTFAELLRQLLGDYGATAATQTFLEQKNERVRDDLAQLPGARLVVAMEVPANQQLAEALMKQLTGGEDYVKARPLYGEYFEFKPQFKVLLMTNHKPVIRGTENAIWNRIHLIPFDVVIPAEEQDEKLLGKLRGELPGVLAWAVRGCREWQERKLDPPEEVRGATREYRTEMDRLGAYLTERCLTGPEARVGLGELHADYVDWCGQDWSLGRNNFGAALRERHFRQEKVSHGSLRRWVGIGLLDRPKRPEGQVGLSLEERDER